MGQTKQTYRKEPSHTRIYRRQMESIAWLHLSGSAVKVLLALATLERGSNNGELFLSDRKGAEFPGLSRNTVWRALNELLDKGFIYRTQEGGFSRKTPHAACYGLTWQAGPKGTKWRAPSHAYEDWRPEADGNTRSQILTETGPVSDQTPETDPDTGADIGPVSLEKSLVSREAGLSGIGPHTVSHRGQAAEPETGQRKQANHTPGAFLDNLRADVADRLDRSPPGEQSRLAEATGIPGGTLSKFLNGRSLPEQYRAPLAAALAA